MCPLLVIRGYKIQKVKFMTNKYSEDLENGLTVGIDYIAYTVTEPITVTEVILMMGFKPDDFVELPRGGFGYKKQLKNESNGISILYDGAEDMGIHVNITGKGIGSLLETFHSTLDISFDGQNYSAMSEAVLGLFFQEVLKVGHFTRIDAAIDDKGGNYFSPDNVFNLFQNGQIVSKWRSVRRTDRYSAPGTCAGYTVYFGSRESLLMLRLYDKGIEQNNHLTPEDDDYIDFNWYRWELEYKDERANEFANVIIDGADLGSIVVGVLSYYIRLIELDDSNKSRCSSLQKWEDFVHGVEQLRLTAEKKTKTVYDKLTWIESQVCPTLATLLLLYDFDQSFIYEMAAKNKHRISKSDWELIRQHRPDVYDMYYEE